MKIVFDLTPLYDHLSGVERYNLNITKEIIRMHPEHHFVLLFKNEIHKDFVQFQYQRNVENIVISRCHKFFFIQFRLLAVLNRIEADYYVFLSFTSPILFKKNKIINAIHDLTCWDCPETIPLKMKIYYRLTYAEAIKRSWRIITVSEFSKKRIRDKYSIPDNKVLVIYNGLSDSFRTSENDEPLQNNSIPAKYILSLSTVEPRKNIQLLIQAYEELIEEGNNLPDLVIAGRVGWKKSTVFSRVLNARIHFVGFVEDELLPCLYRNAELFVFPSKYEGFGIPIIEAMSQGTPVICSDAASLPEVSGGACIMFESNKICSLKNAIKSFYNMPKGKKEEIISVSREIARKYCWEVEAEKLFSYICSVQ